MLEHFGDEIDKALDDVRNAADRRVPRVLSENGPAAALREAGAQSGLTVTVSAHGLTRHPEAIESTIYFCCLEGLQNAAKHAGLDASVAVELVQLDGHVTFTVQDDGAGFDPRTPGTDLDPAERSRQPPGAASSAPPSRPARS